MSEFQPPDPPEPDYDTLADEMFDRYEKCGYAVISRDEWKSKLDDAATDGYAEGRSDEREEWTARQGQDVNATMLDELRSIVQLYLDAEPSQRTAPFWSAYLLAKSGIKTATDEEA